MNSQDSLTIEASVDVVGGEQTWPSEDEIRVANATAVAEDPSIGRNRRVVPKNVSE